jgi:hypothetical protein
VSAGFGKAGAAIGTQVFTLFRQLQEKQPLSVSLVVLGFLRTAIYCFLREGRAVDLKIMDWSWKDI